jgi:hypothetical protein
MLYLDKTLGRAGVAARLFAWMALAIARRRHADLDLLAMSPHLRRDIGMGDAEVERSPIDLWRR